LIVPKSLQHYKIGFCLDSTDNFIMAKYCWLALSYDETNEI